MNWIIKIVRNWTPAARWLNDAHRPKCAPRRPQSREMNFVVKRNVGVQCPWLDKIERRANEWSGSSATGEEVADRRRFNGIIRRRVTKWMSGLPLNEWRGSAFLFVRMFAACLLSGAAMAELTATICRPSWMLTLSLAEPLDFILEINWTNQWTKVWI